MAAFIIDQHGCAKNTVDAEVIAAHLTAAGHTQSTEDSADIIIINSCGFIESAKQESIDAVMNARKRHPAAKILLAGCLAERYAKELAASLPEADGIFGNGDLSKVTDAVAALERGERPVMLFPQKGFSCAERKVFFTRARSAYVRLTEGCNNRCAFCAIPLIRGALRSRPAAEVLQEIRQLAESGMYEINLIGQDVAAYPHLTELLDEIGKMKGRFIVRLLYMHPDHLLEGNLWQKIAAAMQQNSHTTEGCQRSLMPYFDIPFQSGSNRIIQAMGRKGTAAEYIDLVQGIREALPQAAVRTTFMAGFPGEDEEAAEDTLHFLQAIRADWAGGFVYSREEGTAAYSMKGRVPKKVAAKRLAAITAAQERITQEALAARIGQDYDVIIEEIIPATDTEGGLAIGRAWFQAPEVDGAFVIDLGEAAGESGIKEGSVVRVHADAVHGVDISGHLT